MVARKFTGRLATLALSAFAVLGIAGALGATAANASPIVTASTSVTNHPDTTSASGPACTSSANGPVWAIDTYTSQLTAVLTGPDTYQVTIKDHGSFAGFADPANCTALASSGSLLGQYTLTVTSTVAPVAADLHAKYNGPVSTTQMVQDLFGDKATNVAGGDYFFSYQGGKYVQTTSGSTGDVVASSPTPTPTPSASGSTSPTPTPSSSTVIPKGGVQTGYEGRPSTSPWLPFGLGLTGLAAVSGVGAVALRRRQHQGR